MTGVKEFSLKKFIVNHEYLTGGCECLGWIKDQTKIEADSKEDALSRYLIMTEANPRLGAADLKDVKEQGEKNGTV